MKIALLGYMGSGKSAVGKALADSLDLPFYDLDILMEVDLEQKIRDVFETKGEIFFRKAESRVLSNFVTQHESFVLATGGGTPCYANNLKILEDAGVKTVYLNVSIPVLAGRLRKEKSTRPLISHLNDADMIEFIGKHIFERSTYYNQAQLKVATGERSVQEISALIRKRLGEIDSGIAG